VTHNSAPRSKVRVFSLGILLSFCLTVALGLTIVGGAASPASAQGIAISECDNVGTVGPNTITCTITVVNNFTYDPATPNDPTGLATITITCALPTVCTTPGTTTSADPVTSITQCDASGLGGANTVACTVSVTNNLTGYPAGAAIVPTVSQCLNPPLTTSLTCTAAPPGNTQAGSAGPGAQSETQCNSSGGPGGAMTCTATAPPSQSAGLPTTIDQCNGSGGVGASTVICAVTIINNFFGSPAVLPSPIYPPPVATTSTPSTVPATVPTTAPAGSTSTTVSAGTATTTTTPPDTTTTTPPDTTTTRPTTTSVGFAAPAITATTGPSTTGSSSTGTVPGTTIPPATTVTTIFPTMVVPLEKAGWGTTTTAAPTTTTTAATTSTTATATAAAAATTSTTATATAAAAAAAAAAATTTTAAAAAANTTSPIPIGSPGTGGLPPAGRNWSLILGLGLMLLASLSATMLWSRRMLN
jgi:hypothetical protein